ncbi:MAG: hypothetical protein GC179_15270 [Anaerolineaceae bacterium]|nr:hypothetical protein [Anaerolineaceae bacterium]
MNNTGSDNPTNANEAESLPTSRPLPIRIVVMGLVAIVFAIVIGSQVIGVLYAIFFPPAAPIPDQATLISHTSKDYGADDWFYSSNQTPCEVVHFFQTQQAECRVAPVWCDNSASSTPPEGSKTRGQNVARCVGTQNFSIFALRWEAIIATGATANEVTQFRLNREIFWTGAVPPYNAPTLDGGFPNFPTDIPLPTTAS